MMVMTDRHVPPGGVTRASDLTTKRAIAATFVRHGSPRLMIAAVAATLAVRLLVGGWTLSTWARSH